MQYVNSAKYLLLRRDKNIALLLFTRTPEEEVRCKRLIPQISIAKQKRAVAKLIRESRKVLKKTSLPYFVYTSAQQVGNTFAERLHAAFADLFSHGFEQVIAIGNDCPELTHQGILQAVEYLQEREVVVGPDTSGGIYLLGLNQSAFLACSSFAGIRWSTNQVLTDIAALFNLEAESIALQEKHADINNPQDFRQALQRRLFRPQIILFFKSLLSFSNSHRSFDLIHFTKLLYYFCFLFRGPPVTGK